MRRERFSTEDVGRTTTFLEDVRYTAFEKFILEDAYNLHGVGHWLRHLVHFDLSAGIRNEIPPTIEEVSKTISLISDYLKKSGFETQSLEVSKTSDLDELNNIILKQYTEAGDLYREVNSLLRTAQDDISLGSHLLTPWILQLNYALRDQAEFLEISYRGTILNSDDLHMYEEGKVIVWTSFVSATKNKDCCFGGNVIFEIRPVSPLSEYGKRAPREISHLSVFPSEEEVLLPICCAFKIVSKTIIENGVTYIKLELMDHW